MRSSHSKISNNMLNSWDYKKGSVMFKKAYKYSVTMCRLRQDVIDKAKLWRKTISRWEGVELLQKAVDRLEKFEREKRLVR